ncbi:MAG: SDR family oxidoreductase [bacterium]
MRGHGHTRKTALITGSSTGVGYELACRFAADGYDLVLVAHDEQKLTEVQKYFEKEFDISVKTIIKDLSCPESAKEIFTELQNESVGIDVLVNNAGIATYGFFFKTDFETERKMLQLNIGALTHLTKLFLPEMLARGDGKILNISSTAAFRPVPFIAVYYATKAYVLSFSEALAEELQGTGVSVTALCPGFTISDLEKEGEGEEVKIMQDAKLDVKTIAYIGYKGLMQGKRVVIPGFRAKVLAKLVRVTPREIARKIAKRFSE